jgi:glycogen debranching enzyme
LDQEVESGLLSHLNEKEFLSDYGLHSISKLDPAYDQVDIDHGGGGSYVAFPAMIAESLYKAGYPDSAENILERTLWWPERLPYWGDSMVANQIDYRKDTPLQCAMDAAAGAQCVIFGICGIRAETSGEITVNPHPPKFSPNISLNGVSIRGTRFDLTANRNDYEVGVGQKTIRSKIAAAVVLPARG